MKKCYLKTGSKAGYMISVFAIVICIPFYITAQARGSKALIGTWRTQVSVRDCKTGDPLVTFQGLLTYHQGGTLSETTGTNPAARTPGQGTWQYNGDQQFQARFTFFWFDADGTLSLIQKVRQNLIELSPDGNSWVDHSEIELYSPDGTLIDTPCGGATAVRFE